mmetsp:Transcript_21927/g.39792  ORF Transcript_21927/g.39792 Transcript_21927/m.39792 type:complete len:386 (-) Transcript_21927:1273-2430(-)
MGATSLALRAATLARGTLLFVLANHVSTLYAFTYPENFGSIRPYNHQKSALASTTETMTFEPIFDFSLNNTVESFERIDDAIMGGISTSALRDVPREPYASWSGVCRIDGGGFCGMRTLAFEEPLQVGKNADGFYVYCRLTSDNEPERRVWKMTTRTERSRGEELYQAQFTLPKNNTNGEWTRIRIPFSNFRLVRGPRMVQGGTPLNTTGGIYQIGLSLSKFQLSQNTSEIENFRPGFFELQLKAIGVYSNSSKSFLQLSEPNTLSPEESKRRRPLIVKALSPVLSLLFSEQSRRRKSAMKMLMEQKGLSRTQAIMFGIRQRAENYGMFRSVLSYAGFALADSIRAVLRTAINYGVFLPIRLILKLFSLPEKMRSPKTKHRDLTF